MTHLNNPDTRLKYVFSFMIRIVSIEIIAFQDAFTKVACTVATQNPPMYILLLVVKHPQYARCMTYSLVTII